ARPEAAVEPLLLREPTQALARRVLEARARRAGLQDRQHRERGRAHVVLIGAGPAAAVALAEMTERTGAPEALGVLVALEPLQGRAEGVLDRAPLVGNVDVIVH